MGPLCSCPFARHRKSTRCSRRSLAPSKKDNQQAVAVIRADRLEVEQRVEIKEEVVEMKEEIRGEVEEEIKEE